MKLILPLLALAAVIALFVLAGCGEKPDPRIVTQQFTAPVATPCKDARIPPADYPRTEAEMIARLQLEPDAVSRVKRLKQWAVLWMQRLTEDDNQVAVCARP